MVLQTGFIYRKRSLLPCMKAEKRQEHESEHSGNNIKPEQSSSSSYYCVDGSRIRGSERPGDTHQLQSSRPNAPGTGGSEPLTYIPMDNAEENNR